MIYYLAGVYLGGALACWFATVLVVRRNRPYWADDHPLLGWAILFMGLSWPVVVVAIALSNIAGVLGRLAVGQEKGARE